jgi:Zn finger protein HypA/HybF involved in hydrogenase expression
MSVNGEIVESRVKCAECSYEYSIIAPDAMDGTLQCPRCEELSGVVWKTNKVDVGDWSDLRCE